tara:strand:- start:4527 stop:6062 length:1536 start_codon:yes stop_codon:yes gene_type:complete
MAFVDEVGYYAGATSGKNSEVSKFLTNGVQWIISMIEKTNPDMLPLFASLQTLTNSPATLTLSTNSKILDVVRDSADSNGELLKCSPINAAYRSNAENTDSIYYASANSPVYYIDNGVLNILPIPTANQNAKISMVLPDSAVDHNDTTISNFPSEMYHGVILYAAAQLLHHKMSVLNAKLPTDLDADTTVFDAISDISVGLSISTSLPNPISVSSSLPGAISMSAGLPADFSISTSLPSAINVSSAAVGTFADPGSISDISLPSVPAGVANALTKAQNLIDEATVTGDTEPETAQYWLADEDEEMTQATISVAAQELQRASVTLNEYSKEIDKGQAAFSADVSKFQADLQESSETFNSTVQKHQSLLADEQARVNAEITKYQAEIQKEAQKMNVDVSQYSSELSLKAQQMNQQVSAYSSELSEEQAKLNGEITKYQAELAKAQSVIDVELQEYNANLQKKVSLYTTIITKLSTDYQWLQGQYQVVKSELSEFMAPYTAGGSLDSTVEGVRR